MPIDFFKKSCKTTSSKGKFGLCDDPPPSINPAYINENDNSKWIGIVYNEKQKQVDFYAVDNCIMILRNDGKMDHRCDGVLHFDNQLIFIELKSRKKKGSEWLNDGALQLKSTIDAFKKNGSINSFGKVEAYVCNQLKPLANQGHAVKLQKFKDEVGIILKAQQTIVI